MGFVFRILFGGHAMSTRQVERIQLACKGKDDGQLNEGRLAMNININVFGTRS